MICPDCACPETYVVKSRTRQLGDKVRRFRRRECANCRRRFTTREDPVGEPGHALPGAISGPEDLDEDEKRPD